MDVDGLAVDLASRQGGVARRGQLYDLGMTPRTLSRRVQQGQWIPMGRDIVRLRGSTNDLLTRSRAVVLRVPGAVVTGPAAALLLGRGPWDALSGQGKAEVRDAGRHAQRPWVIAARRVGVPAVFVTHPGAGWSRRGGLRVADRNVTIIDLLRFLPAAAAQKVAYRALQTRAMSPDTLRQAAERLNRHAGAAQLRRLSVDVSAGAHAESERLLIELVKAAGLTGWVANRSIPLTHGTVAGDLVFWSPRLVIEADGRAWHTAPERFQADRTRQNALVQAGWTVLRFTWDDLTQRPDRVIDQIRRHLASQGR